jgi:predicted metalloprotease with PDZ domain
MLAPSFAVDPFFSDYVQGTAELDYATYLGYAGLRLVTDTTVLASPGFSAAKSAVGLLAVESVEQGSDAQRAGLRPGDVLLEADNQPLVATSDGPLPQWKPGQPVAIQIARGGVASVLRFRIGVTQQVSFQIVEDLAARALQLRVREGLLKGTTTSTPISGKP